MQNELISVIVPVYNAGRYLHECVKSILSQSYSNIEVILVNDGSTDNSRAICDEFASADSRIKVVHKANGGAAGARNSGLEIACGAFVTFVDSDDTIDADACEKLHKRILETGADICVCGFKLFYDGYRRIVKVPCEQVITPVELWQAFIKDFRTYFTLFSGPYNKLFRQDILNNDTNSPIRFPEHLSNGEDIFFNIDCISAAAKGIAFIDFTPYNCIQTNNPSSLSKSGSLKNIKEPMEHLCQAMLDALPEKTSEINKIIDCQININLIFTLHTAIINKLKPPFKLTWNMVSVILHNSSDSTEKLSALLMYFLPRPLYITAFKLYCKGTLQ